MSAVGAGELLLNIVGRTYLNALH